MVRIYLSGTGNAKYCIEKLTKLMDENSKTVPLESDTLIEEIKKSIIVLGYPIQYSNAPFMVRDFIKKIRNSGEIKRSSVLRQWGFSAKMKQVAALDC